jgi:hypothetical protein
VHVYWLGSRTAAALSVVDVAPESHVAYTDEFVGTTCALASSHRIYALHTYVIEGCNAVAEFMCTMNT